jgi:hypothetical protein
MITPRGHIKLLLQDSALKRSAYQDAPWSHPFGGGGNQEFSLDFLNKSFHTVYAMNVLIQKEEIDRDRRKSKYSY